MPTTTTSFFVLFAILSFYCARVSMLRSFVHMRPMDRLIRLKSTLQPSAGAGSAFGSLQTSTAPTLKTMVFMDGTWLYYSLVQGRSERECPVLRKFGPNWQKTHKIDWKRLPQIIATEIREQIGRQNILSPNVNVDITRTCVFTSLRADTEVGSPREVMVSNFYQNNFDVHRFETKMQQEKCVDISLAVEMLFMATVPGAYDIAVIVTGDKDFMPAMEKTRLLGKRVAICSIRNSVNPDLIKPEARIRDYDVIWIDEHLDKLFVPIHANKDERESISTKLLLEAIPQILARSPSGEVTARHMGRELQTHRVDGLNLLAELKEHHGSLRSFLSIHNDKFDILPDPVEPWSFVITTASTAAKGDGARSGRGVPACATHAGETDGESEDEDCSDGSLLVNGKPRAKVNYSKKAAASAQEGDSASGTVKILIDHIRQLFVQENTDRLNSRDVGRFLQSVPFSNSNGGGGVGGGESRRSALNVLKSQFSSLFGFCDAHSATFATEVERDPEIGGFWLRIRDSESCVLEEVSIDSAKEASRATDMIEKKTEDEVGASLYSPYSEAEAEELFSRSCGLPPVREERSSPQQKPVPRLPQETPRQRAMRSSSSEPRQAEDVSAASPSPSPSPAEGGPATEYAAMRLAELKDVLRGINLPVSGTKKELLDRLEEHQRSALYDWSRKND